MSQNMLGRPGDELLAIAEDFITKLRNGSIKPFQAKRFLRKENPFDLAGVEIDWAKVYEVLGMKTEYEAERERVATGTDPAFWDTPAIRGVTPNLVVKTFRTLGVKVWTYKDDLDADVTTNDRDPKNGSYSIRFQRTIEADPENANQSADDRKGLGAKDITLLERLLLGLGYFLATEGEYLDVKNVTLCSGSRDSDGNVPCEYWGAVGRKLYVSWCGPASCNDGVRARAVVS